MRSPPDNSIELEHVTTFQIDLVSAPVVWPGFSCCFSAGLSDKQLLQPTDDALELGGDRELQRSLSRFVVQIPYVVKPAAGNIQTDSEGFDV